ncbi:unnamed protein product [Symbiodinium natans]|uniref:Uncharacterized protein n=1 Tax=Symbiodinium natans TaxID=878477 RepID=A0A812IJI0_9DINO|nr:unnamed protein product [Symbiodinium natans]
MAPWTRRFTERPCRQSSCFWRAKGSTRCCMLRSCTGILCGLCVCVSSPVPKGICFALNFPQ